MAPPSGSGGFGALFEAENTAGEKVAVKLLPEAPGAERDMLFSRVLDRTTCRPATRYPSPSAPN
ncbi:hypothetical protein [Streptomyces sp. NPDC059881]|uniref:hypothetical protein n=1 Tax=Streptomyces sp. NPDC059881 TaxID=3346986 RepID=UPI0036603F9F